MSGHFFSLSPAGAKAEIKAYGVNVDDYELIEYKVKLKNFLNLTGMDELTWFYKNYFEHDRHFHWAIVLDALLNQEKGGDTFNDFAGHSAFLAGYRGVVFFGARAIEKYWPDPGSLKVQERDLDLIGYDTYPGMLADKDCINVAIYSVHNVVQCIRCVKFKDKIVDNAYFDQSYKVIESLFNSDPTKPASQMSHEDLLNHAGRFAWGITPKIS